MSVIIKVNGPDPLVAHAVKQGDTWELIRVKGLGKDRKLVTLWPTNAPTGIKEGDTFRVTSIESFKVASKQDPRGGWHDEISLNVAVEKVGGMPGTMRKPKTTNYESSAPQWSPPPKEEEAPMFELDGDDEGLPF
jgi:hypothetical protein